VSVALVIHHAMRMRRIIMSSLTLSGCTIFSHVTSQRQDFREKKVIEHKMCVLIFCTNLSETFLILRRTERHVVDQVRSFSYLGTIMNGNNTLEEKIRERIVKGNKAFYANRAPFKSKLVSRKSKLKLYWSVIRPVVVYGCGTWALKGNIIQRLSVFERKILRNIFGPTKEGNGE